MSPLSRSAALALAVLAALALGCGAPAKAPRRSGPAAKARPAGDDGSDSFIAERARLATLARRGTWGSDDERVRAISELVAKAARDNSLTEAFIYGIIWVESRFDPEAVSPVGARGLMQLMPKTADYLAECIGWRGRADSFDPEFNVAAGSYYIARLVKQFGGDEELALAAYNAGPTNVNRWLRDDGLPKVSIEYHTMVQTARGFFGGAKGDVPPAAAPTAPAVPAVPAAGDLDRLGLAILIAGLSEDEFGLQRTDDPTPFQ
jgi:soluble lytic murein transglycosylase-like protein